MATDNLSKFNTSELITELKKRGLDVKIDNSTDERVRKEIGKRIRDIRITSEKIRRELNGKKPTLERFAELVDSNKSNVSRWERGLNIPNEITLRKIADYGNISVDELRGCLNGN